MALILVSAQVLVNYNNPIFFHWKTNNILKHKNII